MGFPAWGSGERFLPGYQQAGHLPAVSSRGGQRALLSLPLLVRASAPSDQGFML